MSRCLPAGLDFMAMNDANPVRFPLVFEGILFAHQFGLPLLSAPGADNPHR